MCDFHGELIQLEGYEVLGQLPDPFVFADGTQMKTKEQWEERRKELYETAIELQYGTQPPVPEFLEVEAVCKGTVMDVYRITTGTYSASIIMKMIVFKPEEEGRYPAVIDGDLCWPYVFDKKFISSFTDNGIMLVMFDRTDLSFGMVPDERKGPLYDVYRGYTFGTIGAWAWGFSRCVDALEKLNIADMSCIAFSGHSRGGKTALLAGALDERAAIVNPNGSGSGGSGCYRIDMRARGQDDRNEKISDWAHFGIFNWFGPEMRNYQDREAALPFDEHYLKALVAPRILIETNGASDIWANPVGTWQTAMAAKEVYRFLGAEENIYLYFRKGGHAHSISDLEKLVSVIKKKTLEIPAAEGSFWLPFEPVELIFDWKCPREGYDAKHETRTKKDRCSKG